MDWKKIVSVIAPTLAGAFGTPLAGMAMKQLCDKFLGNPNATEEELSVAVQNMSPADIIRIKEIDADFQKTLSDNGIKLAEIDARDRDSARNMSIQMRDWSPTVLMVLVYGFYAWMFDQLLHTTMEQSVKDVLLPMVGVLTTIVIQVTNFKFGSSEGSKSKTTLLAQAEPIK